MLRGASGGYTILELMIVLAVSLIILVSAALAIHGASGKTQFSQSMRDINSKLISLMADVTNGFPGGSNTSYKCTLDTANRPQINSDPSGNGSTNPQCVFIGKVIQFTTSPGCSGCSSAQPSTLYSYSVFGRRTMNAAGDLSDNIYDANPVPAVGNANPTAAAGNADLTQTYSLPGGTTVKSISAKLANNPNGVVSTRLLGITQSFNANPSPANGSQNLYVYSNLVVNSPPGNTNGGSSVSNCIELTAAGPCKLPAGQNADTWPPAVISWQACFASSYDSETARITVFSNNGLSAQTKLEFIAC